MSAVDRFLADMGADLDGDYRPSENYARAMRETDAAFDAWDTHVAAPVQDKPQHCLGTMIAAAILCGVGVALCAYFFGHVFQ